MLTDQYSTVVRTTLPSTWQPTVMNLFIIILESDLI
jgi:hypothetical protein